MPNPAAIVDYASLQETAAAYLLQLDVSATDVPLFITLAEDTLSDDLRLESVLTKLDSTAVNAATKAVPTNYVDTLLWRLGGDPPTVLEFIDAKLFSALHERNRTGRPVFYTVLRGNFEFAPPPDQSYASELFYLGTVTPLSTGSPTNELLPGHPMLYLSAVLVQAYTFFEDDASLARWEKIYAAEKQSLMARELRRRWRQNDVMRRV